MRAGTTDTPPTEHLMTYPGVGMGRDRGRGQGWGIGPHINAEVGGHDGVVGLWARARCRWGVVARSQVVIHIVGPVPSGFSIAEAAGSVEVEKRIHPINRSLQAAKGGRSHRLVGEYLSSGSKRRAQAAWGQPPCPVRRVGPKAQSMCMLVPAAPGTCVTPPIPSLFHSHWLLVATRLRTDASQRRVRRCRRLASCVSGLSGLSFFRRSTSSSPSLHSQPGREVDQIRFI